MYATLKHNDESYIHSILVSHSFFNENLQYQREFSLATFIKVHYQYIQIIKHLKNRFSNVKSSLKD